MGGDNPYIEATDVPLPTQVYTITFQPEGRVVEVNPSELPYSREGRPGSILEIAIGHDIDIDHACGGVCACSTCHIVFKAGFASCPEAGEDEEDQLDNAPGLESHSRLACQAVPDGSTDIVVTVPNWNRNHVSEEHD
jgi:2Fe-2S ferredoxin